MLTKRRAFTLVELLVVIAIIGTLVALLLPAVQAAREAARRSQCQNNLKQVALSTLNYEAVNKILPGGVGTFGCCWGTWQMRVLPFLELQNMSDQYENLDGNDGTGPRYGAQPVNINITSRRIASLTCPTDTPNAPIGNPPITSHSYVVNYGNTSFFQSTLNDIPFLGAPFNAYTGSTSDDGPVGAVRRPWPRVYGRPVELAEILDGTSSTLMFAEVIQGKKDDLRGFTWWGGASGFVTFLAPNSNSPDVVTGGICRSLQDGNPPCVTASTRTRPRMMGARSLHAGGGVQVAFCDGHVDFVSNTIDYESWQALGTAAGAETDAQVE